MQHKKLLVAVLAIALFVIPSVMAVKPTSTCVTIQDGVLTYAIATGYANHYLGSDLLTTGFDIFGNNYQGHMFNGYYCNNYLGRDGFPPYEGDDDAYAQRLEDEEFTTNPYGAWYWVYRDVWLVMKWNDAWLSNKDCNADNVLDRHHGFDSYIGSGAWLTDHMSGTDDGIHWVYFAKFVALDHPIGEYENIDGILFYNGEEVGELIWGQHVVIQRVYNEQGGPHGIEYLVQPAGFGTSG